MSNERLRRKMFVVLVGVLSVVAGCSTTPSDEQIQANAQACRKMQNAFATPSVNGDDAKMVIALERAAKMSGTKDLSKLLMQLQEDTMAGDSSNGPDRIEQLIKTCADAGVDVKPY